MDITILENRDVIQEKIIAGTMNENLITTLEFTYPEAYADYDKKIVFITDDGVVSDVLDDDTYTIKNSITKYSKVYCYVSFFNDDEENFRSKEFVLRFYTNHETEDEITEEETSVVNTLITTLNEQIEAVEELKTSLEEALEKVEALDTSSTSSSSGTTDYTELENKPSINSVTLEGDKSFEDLGSEALTNTEIEDLLS